jgi:class 3 adenylate cyclase/tetratricopeptide (TPR) repeat protein
VQRKTVTVLFCDVTGSTALGESVDPEALRGVLARYFERMSGIVERHGGTVEKFIGDAVMAVFGVPAAHEDDALRALHAAAEMRDALPELGIQARIGVNTGEVVTGTEERLVTGDAVNVAARLEQAAAPGEVLLGEPTFALVRTTVTVESVEPLELKGKAEPVRAYRLLHVHEAPERAHETPFVGRTSEVAAIRDVWQRAHAEQRCELVTVIADAGVGKSRLVAEALAVTGARVVRGRCLPYGEGITYWPVVEVLKQLDLEPADEAAATAIRSLLGESEVTNASEEIAWAVRKTFEQAAPLIVVFDDIHWGEDTFLDLVEHVALLSSGARLLLVCLSRPELLERRPQWPIALRLEPLAEDDVQQLIPARIVGELREKITRAAGGNPLFIGEMLAMASEPDGAVVVPPTLRALLAARLDQLEQRERYVLERGAVEGEIFHRGAVQALAPEEPQVTPRLAALVRKELIRPEKAQLAGEDGFRFRHLLIRDAAYEALTKTVRAELHEGFARWLEQRGAGLVELDEIVGYHLEQACRYRDELGSPDPALASRAAERLGRAGERALIRGDIPAAVNLLERSKTLASTESFGSLESLGIARMEAGDLDGADQALTAAIERAEQAGDRRLAARAALARSSLRLMTGRTTPDEVRSEAEAAVLVLDRLRDDAGLARAWLQLTDVSAFDSDMAGMQEAAERALVHARRAGLVREEADALFWAFTGALYGERPVPEAIDLCERQLAETRGPLAEVGLLEILAALRLRNGEVAEGRELYGRGDTLYRELGMRFRAAINLQCQGTSELATGDFLTAEEVLRKAIEEFEEMGERGVSSTAAALLAHALCAQRQYEQAASSLDTSEQLTHPDDRWNQALIPSGRARVLAARGEIESALALAHEALTVATELDSPEVHAQALVAFAEVLGCAGRPAEQGDALRKAFDLYERKGNRPAAARIHAQLAELATVSPP